MRGSGVGGRASAVWVGLAMAVASQCLPGRAEGPATVATGDGLTFEYFSGSNFSRSKTNAIGVYRMSSEDVVKGSGADVHITPDGRFVYASTREHDSIAGFAIDQKSGEITALGQTATARGPRDFAIDPSGRFLVAGGTGRAIVVHAIDQETGQATPKHRYEVRTGPVWVEVVSFRNKESTP